MIRMILTCLIIFAAKPSLMAKQQTTQQDTTILIAIDGYWKKLLSINERIYVIGCSPGSALQFQDQETNEFGQQIIKTDSGIFVHLAATGILYKGSKINDSALKFTRVDNTHNKYYNQGGHLIAQHENIFMFGGYGFWKSNGHLKKFNFRDKEWDIVPLSEEIHTPLVPKPGIWHDTKEEKIYLLYQNVINDAIKTEGKKLPENDGTYILDLKTSVWKRNLPLHPKALEVVKNGVHQLSNGKGFYVFKGIDLYVFDIKSNRILKSNDRSYSQSFARVLLQDMFYAVNNSIYFKDRGTGKLDSLLIPNNKFSVEPYPIFKRSIPEYAIWITLLLLLISASVFAFLKISAERAMLSHATGKFSFDGRFSSTEIALITLLITKSRNKKKANIDELNYTLGVKDKNTGLQKKVRSEVINSINEKYRYISGEEIGLISSERSNMDKRYFEYFIPYNKIRIAEEICRSNA